MGFAPFYFEHAGKRILRLDYSGLQPLELPPAFDEAARVIASGPPRSQRILTILDSRFDERSAEALKRYAAANQPYVLCSAAIARGFWNAVVASIKLHGRGDLALFDDEGSALSWLARK